MAVRSGIDGLDVVRLVTRAQEIVDGKNPLSVPRDKNWGRINHGVSIEELSAALALEGNSKFVNQAYQMVLLRPADTGNPFVNRLEASDLTRLDVIGYLRLSGEGRRRGVVLPCRARLVFLVLAHFCRLKWLHRKLNASMLAQFSQV